MMIRFLLRALLLGIVFTNKRAAAQRSRLTLRNLPPFTITLQAFSKLLTFQEVSLIRDTVDIELRNYFMAHTWSHSNEISVLDVSLADVLEHILLESEQAVQISMEGTIEFDNNGNTNEKLPSSYELRLLLESALPDEHLTSIVKTCLPTLTSAVLEGSTE